MLKSNFSNETKMLKNKTLNNDNSIIVDRELYIGKSKIKLSGTVIILSKLFITSLVYISIFVILSLYSQVRLMEIARLNYRVNKEIEMLKTDIDMLKSELIKYNDIENISKLAKKSGFKDIDDVIYVK